MLESKISKTSSFIHTGTPAGGHTGCVSVYTYPIGTFVSCFVPPTDGSWGCMKNVFIFIGPEIFLMCELGKERPCYSQGHDSRVKSTVQVLSRILLYEEYYVDVFLVAPARFRRSVHQCRRLPQSTSGNINLGDRQKSRRLTAAAKSSIAFPAMSASSWLSFISKFMTWTGLLSSPPLDRRSSGASSFAIDDYLGRHDVPSHTASKQRSSQVNTTSTTVLVSCQRSGANFMRLFRSSICKRPLAV